MRWEILCLTMLARYQLRNRLIDNLIPQICKHPEVKLTITLSVPEQSLGANREAMRQASTADYINFVDDDDLVAPDYVARILPLLDGVDYIGFRLQCYVDGTPLPKPTYHSLLCGSWFETPYGYHRDISHLNPMRRELALAKPMWGGFAEDSRWANDLRTIGTVRTEHFIEDTMYHYYYRSDKTDGVNPAAPLTLGPCPQCSSTSTVKTAEGSHCNTCALTWR
jgi:hypothetical protein